MKGKIVTFKVEVLNEDIPDDRIAYMVFGALDKSRIKAVAVNDVRASEDIKKTDEERVKGRMAERAETGKAST